jgi:hypothetical protein
MGEVKQHLKVPLCPPDFEPASHCSPLIELPSIVYMIVNSSPKKSKFSVPPVVKPGQVGIL